MWVVVVEAVEEGILIYIVYSRSQELTLGRWLCSCENIVSNSHVFKQKSCTIDLVCCHERGILPLFDLDFMGSFVIQPCSRLGPRLRLIQSLCLWSIFQLNVYHSDFDDIY